MRKKNLSQLESDPNILQRLFLTQGVLSFLIILCFSGLGIYTVATGDVSRTAEQDAERIAKVIVDQQYPYLFSHSETDVALDPRQVESFDRQVKIFLRPFDIVRIKVINLNATIVYSTDPKLIGLQDKKNELLKNALRGEVDSHQETKDNVVDLAKEQRFDVDVVETYLPLVNRAGKIAGVFEIDLDVTHYRDEVRTRVASSVLILTIILLVVILLSYIVVNIGTQQLKKLLNRLHQMAMTDALTGIYNRGAVMARAEEELSRLARQKNRLSGKGLVMILIDLDHFKRINDTYGHQVGDEVLREMVWRIHSCLRDYDVFGRYGGEEFLVISPDSSIDGGELLAERIRQVVTETPFKVGLLDLPVSASFGVSCCSDPAEGVHIVLQQADVALYQAKEAGRNRVIGWK